MFKHALLLRWLRALTASGGPLELLDTHAGSGLYDLSAPPAGRAGEARQGIARFMSEPADAPELQELAEQVRALNGGGEGPLYPGSPLLALNVLRPQDRYVGCELQPEEADRLDSVLRRSAAGATARVLPMDGYQAATMASAGVRRAVLIDPPFERGDEAARLSEAASAAMGRGEPVLIWAPLKDLDGFDRLLGRLEACAPPASAAVQLRLRPLDDPMRLNGCAMVMLGGPDLSAEAEAIAAAVAARCGGPGAGAVVDRFGGPQPGSA